MNTIQENYSIPKNKLISRFKLWNPDQCKMKVKRQFTQCKEKKHEKRNYVCDIQIKQIYSTYSINFFQGKALISVLVLEKYIQNLLLATHLLVSAILMYCFY